MSTTAAAADYSTASVGYLEFLQSLERYLARPRKTDEPCGMVVVHMCNLTRINTSAGYRTGSRLRRDFIAELQQMLREDDWMRPLTEDRLGIVLHRVKNQGHTLLATSRIVQIATNLSRPESGNASLEVRVGAAMFPEHGNTAELLLRNSELAVASALLHRTSSAIYVPEVSKQMTGDWGLETELCAGIENSEFELAYQPKIDARSMSPCGAEALLRWQNPRLGAVSPNRFIAVAEACDRIDALTNFALHSAARDAASWPHLQHELTIAINLSPTVIEQGDIVSSFENVAAIWGIGIERMTAEVTENGIISTAGAALRILQDLRDAGVRVSIDDFGTGNSSLAYFKDIPADELKIDKSFVLAMLSSDTNDRLVKTIIDLAHGFKLTVVAEGVETAQCAERLQELGCDVLQGFHFSKPLTHSDFLDYLESGVQRGQDTPSR